MASYTPPLGNAVEFDFGAAAYTPAVGNDVTLILTAEAEPISVLGEGWLSSSFGTAALALQNRELPVEGFDASSFGTSLVTFDIYFPPAGNAVALTFDSFSYTPFNGNAVFLDFDAVALEQFITDVTLGGGEVFGGLFVSGGVQETTPDGIFEEAFGATTLYNLTQVVLAAGWTSSVVNHFLNLVGTPSIAPGGIAPYPQTGPTSGWEVPPPGISFYTRYIDLTLGYGISAGAFSLPAVTQEVQYTGPFGGINEAALGTARIEYADRTIEVPFISSLSFGTAAVRHEIVVEPAGHEDSVVSGAAEVVINTRRVYGEGWTSAAVGEPSARLQFRNVYPQTWISASFNPPTIYNQTQALTVGPFLGSNLPPEVFGALTRIENVDRELRTFGHSSSRLGLSAWIRNAAQAVLPEGAEQTLWGSALIAPAIRDLPLPGWDSFTSTSYHVVYNLARLLSPAGIVPSNAFGVATVGNRNRTVRQVFPYEGQSWGTAFAAYAVRSLAPGVFVLPAAAIPDVRLNPHPISPAGIAPPPSSGPTVFEHFTVFRPISTNVHAVPWIGEPFVFNRNRTLSPTTRDHSDYGRPRIFNYVQSLSITAGDTLVFGPIVVAQRTRTVLPGTISVPTIAVTHRIRNDSPDPPSLQRVYPGSMFLGTELNVGSYGLPDVRFPTIYPPSLPTTSFGTLTVRTNGIAPGSIFNETDDVGSPIVVGPRFVYPERIPFPSEPGQGESDRQFPAPRVSPHTIYAPDGDQATAQAVENHNDVTGSRIDEDLSSLAGQHSYLGGWPFFGKPEVSNYSRGLQARWWPSDSNPEPGARFGDAEVANRLRRVYPAGIRSDRYGLVVFWGVAQYITLDAENDGIEPAEAFGAATVEPYLLNRPVYPAGFDATGWASTTLVELLNRTVAIAGIPHQGNPTSLPPYDVSPFGITTVGYPREYTLGGYDMTLWGDTWVSHRIRSLPMEGFESLSLIDEDIGTFHERMTVRGKARTGTIAGIPPTVAFGTPDVSSGVRSIFGRTVFGYTGGVPSVKTVNYVQPSGWESLAVGDIDEWEADKVKAHGDDLSYLGVPRMGRAVYPDGVDSEEAPTARVAVPIYVGGMPEIGFAGPSVTNPYGCSNRVITVLPILSPSTPTPAVA